MLKIIDLHKLSWTFQLILLRFSQIFVRILINVKNSHVGERSQSRDRGHRKESWELAVGQILQLASAFVTPASEGRDPLDNRFISISINPIQYNYQAFPFGNRLIISYYNLLSKNLCSRPLNRSLICIK